MSDRELTFSRWGEITPPSNWSLASGFFINSNRADLFGYHPSNGTLWVGENTGTGFTFRQWANVTPLSDWQFVAGDFKGGGRSDVVGYHPSNGTVWMGENLGSSFQFRQWATVSPAAGWQFAAGYFTGYGKMDLVGYHPGNGTLWVGQNTGTGFTFREWGTVTPASDWRFVAGDFTGDGRTGVVGYHPSNGTLWIGENGGNRFEFRHWGTVSPASDWQFISGNFTSRGKADLLGYYSGNGTLWIGENTTTGFVFWKCGNVTPVSDWQFVAGAFDTDAWTDVVGYHPSNGSLWMAKSTRAIEGYCYPLSASPGEDISFMLSGEGESSAVFSRHISVGANVISYPVGVRSFDSTVQPLPAEVWRVGCGWDETFRLTIPESWTSGVYSAMCFDSERSKTDITFIVKPSQSDRSQLAVLANVNTWLAYNGWGGRSKYDGAARVSFLRPNPSAKPEESMHLTRGELWVLGWLEQEGYRPDVYSDIDFHNGFDNFQYKCLVLSTHPEYWTTEMYDNLKAFLDAGGSVVYLGGNGIYENGEYEDSSQTSMAFRLGVENGPRVNALFRILSPPRPERSILGVATERCGVSGSPYEVLRAEHFLFAETGLRNGDTFGNSGLNTGYGNGKASAWEVDTSNGPGATAIPADCGTESGSPPPSQLPDGLVVLARGQHDGVGTGAEMVYYDHPGGGFVFSVGSITFGGSLVVDSAIQQIMRNVLTKAGVV